ENLSTAEHNPVLLSSSEKGTHLVIPQSSTYYWAIANGLLTDEKKKNMIKEPVRHLGKDSRGLLRPSVVSWCETPKVYKRDSSLRHRLPMCKPSTDVKDDNQRSPCTNRTESSVSVSFQSRLSESPDSLDMTMEILASNTLKADQDLALSGRKRRLFFTQLRTSTLEDDSSHNSSASDQPDMKTPDVCKFRPVLSKESSQSPVSSENTDLYDSSSVLIKNMSALTPFCPWNRSVDEDSGFSSLTLDKSQASMDHDGSFQELLLSASRGNCETPNLAESKRRSRLQRQHRLSTLKEGGSQSEEDPTNREHLHPCPNHSKDDVFADKATPCSLSVKPDLSLTPALQLVHAMCQHKTQMFAGQSPSLKETTMPLAGLIGRKMGLVKVDILTELKKRNLRHILAVILGSLSSESVCKSWNQIIQQDKRASQRRRNHLSQVEAALEVQNIPCWHAGAVHVSDAETRVALLQRSGLKTVQAQSRNSSYCTPQSGSRTLTPLLHDASHSGSSSSKRDKFLEVAKTLFNDKYLKPCPRCQHPARCHSVKKEGVCSRADCGFQFCTSCLCAFHSSQECGSQSAGRRKKDILLPGSTQSKRNIRRL
uniref:F-box protein 43 n=1 Tax=Acanthochromis polyacanthus TaxID=80966 RepID=A0A3Q1G6G2_9TELE